MTTMYGYKAEDWETAKDEKRQILIERACVRGMIPYSDLVSRVKTIRMAPDSFALAHMLGEISEAEDAAGWGMLSVIVVHKDGDMQPGPGVFQLAKKLGRDASDTLVCWIDELKRVHAHWSTAGNHPAGSLP
jgi:hypothetical protein